MRRIKFQIIMILLLVATGFSQNQRIWLERELQKTQMRIQKVERLIHFIHNDQLMMEWQNVKNDFEQARQLFMQQKFQLCKIKLQAVNTKIAFILKTISDHPLFRRKFIRDLDYLLTQLEKKVQNTDNEMAQYYLREAYKMKKQGEFILTNRPDAFYQGIEMLVVARNLAEKAMQILAYDSPGATDGRFLQQYLRQVQQKYEKAKSLNSLSEKEIHQIEKLYEEAQLSYENGKSKVAYMKLKQIDQLISRRQLGDMSLSKLLNQFYRQRHELTVLREKEIKDDIVLKIMDRIDENLVKIDNAIENNQFEEANRLLKVNFQLFRTINTMEQNTRGDRKVLSRQFERFSNEVAVLKGKDNIDPSVIHMLEKIQHRIREAMENGNRKRAARLLKRGYNILKTYYSTEGNEFVSRRLIRQFVNMVERNLDRLSEEDQKIARDTITKIRRALKNNNIEKAKRLAQFLKQYLED